MQDSNNEQSNNHLSGNPAIFEKAIKEKYMEFYENKLFDFLETGWSFLGEAQRLEIIFKAFNDGIERFYNQHHFDVYRDDIVSVINAKSAYAEKFNLTSSQLSEILRGFRGKKFDKKKASEAKMIKEVAAFVRLKEYYALTQKYEHFSLELAGLDYNIFKIDSRRTESRIKFLLELNNGKIPDNDEFIDDLVMARNFFWNEVSRANFAEIV